MQIHDRIQRSLALLKIVVFIIPIIAVTLSNNAFAQYLHDRTLYEAVKQTSGLGENAKIDVGKSPAFIDLLDTGDLNSDLDDIYVSNRDSATVSVISAVNHTKIKDIPVGDDPIEMNVDDSGTLYVSNRGSGTVSVISGENYTKIKDIPVGERPSEIAVWNRRTNTLYILTNNYHTVSVISGENYTKIKDIPLEGEGASIAVDVHVHSGTIFATDTTHDTVSVFSGRDYTKIKDIPVGDFPGYMVFDEDSETLYVSNRNSATVSVISAVNHTKIKDIPVGESPQEMVLNLYSPHTLYVTNSDSDTVSVISRENYTKIKDIPVGDTPAYIAVQNFLPEIVYVSNIGSGTVSVISGENYTKIKDIPVGESPTDIAVDEYSSTVYVVNSKSNSISVIDGIANEVVAGIIFQVNPFNSGVILCDGLTSPSPIGQYTYVYSGAQCTAKPNEGFEFVSWEEKNLRDNSTQLITSSPAASPLDSIANLFGIELNEPEATLNITKFGSFTANFKELPPAVPSEYLIPLYGIIASTIVGWSIPSIISWTKSKRDVGKLNYYHKQIACLYEDGKLDENDIGELDRLRSRVSDAYSEGKLNEKHYESLKNEISVLYEKIFRKRIGSLQNENISSGIKEEPSQDRLTRLKNDIEFAYSEGKLNEKHYDLLNKAISTFDGKVK